MKNGGSPYEGNPVMVNPLNVPKGLPPPVNFHLLITSFRRLLQGSANDIQGSGVGHQAMYRLFYYDVMWHRAPWFSFFQDPANLLHAQHTINIFHEIVCSCLRGRMLDKAFVVIKTMGCIVKVADMQSCEEAIQQYRTSKYELHFQRKEFDRCIPLFCGGATHE